MQRYNLDILRGISECRWSGSGRLKTQTNEISIYTLSDLGVLSNLIGSLSLANEHYSPPTEWIMRKPNKNKMAGVNSSFASVSESIFNENFVEITSCVYTKTIILLNLGE